MEEHWAHVIGEPRKGRCIRKQISQKRSKHDSRKHQYWNSQCRNHTNHTHTLQSSHRARLPTNRTVGNNSFSVSRQNSTIGTRSVLTIVHDYRPCSVALFLKNMARANVSRPDYPSHLHPYHAMTNLNQDKVYFDLSNICIPVLSCLTNRTPPNKHPNQVKQ